MLIWKIWLGFAREINNNKIFNNDIFIFAGKKIELNDKLRDLEIKEGSTI